MGVCDVQSSSLQLNVTLPALDASKSYKIAVRNVTAVLHMWLLTTLFSSC